MKLNILQLNLYRGKYLERATRYISEMDPDLVNLQEINGGSTALGTHKDNFAFLKKKLKGYMGELAVRGVQKGEPDGYFGNASFFKNNFKLLEQDIFWFRGYKEVDFGQGKYYDYPYNLQSLLLQKDKKKFYLLCTHFVWGPNPKDREYKLKQGRKLINYIKKLHHPFVLTGDFNLTPDSKIIRTLGSMAQNLPVSYGATNSLNMRVHYAGHTLPKDGFLVDYIFASKHFKILKFMIDSKSDLSDHLPLTARLELR